MQSTTLPGDEPPAVRKLEEASQWSLAGELLVRLRPKQSSGGALGWIRPEAS